MDPQFDTPPGIPFGSQPATHQGLPVVNVPAGAYVNPQINAATLPVPSVLPPQSLGLPPAAIPTGGLPAAQPGRLPAAMPSAVPGNTDDSADQEWIRRAREIVQRTINDPYLQSQELGKIKADYLETKYNKHIKVGENKSQ